MIWWCCKHTASSGKRIRSTARYPLVVSVGIIFPAPTLDFSSPDILNLYFGRILRSASDAPSYNGNMAYKRDKNKHLQCCHSILKFWIMVKGSLFIPVLPQHKELQWCMANSNKEQFRSNMPEQHKRWQRRRQMRGKPQTTCTNSKSDILLLFRSCKLFRYSIRN